MLIELQLIISRAGGHVFVGDFDFDFAHAVLFHVGGCSGSWRDV